MIATAGMNDELFESLGISNDASNSRKGLDKREVKGHDLQPSHQCQKAVEGIQSIIFGIIVMLELNDFELLWQPGAPAELGEEGIRSGAIEYPQRLELPEVDDSAVCVGSVPQIYLLQR